MVDTPEAAADFVSEVGFCLWRAGRIPFALQSLEDVTPWQGDAIFLQTWFWKDDLHTEKRLFYGQLVGRDGVPCFASWEFLPYLIAAVGDNDARTLYETNRLSHVALTLFEHVERHGPTAKRDLPYPAKTGQTPPLIALQQHFLFAKHGITGRTRGTYGYVWGLCDAWTPDSFAAAAKLSVGDARAEVCRRLREQDPRIADADVAKLFRWREDAA